MEAGSTERPTTTFSHSPFECRPQLPTGLYQQGMNNAYSSVNPNCPCLVYIWYGWFQLAGSAKYVWVCEAGPSQYRLWPEPYHREIVQVLSRHAHARTIVSDFSITLRLRLETRDYEMAMRLLLGQMACQQKSTARRPSLWFLQTKTIKFSHQYQDYGIPTIHTLRNLTFDQQKSFWCSVQPGDDVPSSPQSHAN